MEILSKELIIDKKDVNFTDIEDYFKKIGITPLRWAITSVNETSYIIDYSYKNL